MGKRQLAFKLAWHKTVSELIGSNVRLAAAVVLSGLVSFASFKTQSALGREWAGDELIPVFVGPISFALVFLVLLLGTWLFRTPYEQWTAVEWQVAELERRLSPRFSLTPFVGRKPEEILYGQTVTTAGGEKFTNSHSSNDTLCIPVNNETAVTLRSCEAYLSRLEEADGSGEPRAWESIRLSWLPMAGESVAVDIPSHGKRSVFLFKVIGNRAHLVTDQAPVKMIHFIKDKGEYDGLVVLTAQDAAATFVAFRLTCDAPRNPPTLSIMRKGLADEADEHGWAIERDPIA